MVTSGRLSEFLKGQGAGSDGFRFAVIGALNTALTAAIYLGLSYLIPERAAYAIAWAVGIVFVWKVYPDLVFVGGRNSTRSRYVMASVPVVAFLVGLYAIEPLTAAAGNRLSGLVLTLVVTSGVTFVLSRAVARYGRGVSDRFGDDRSPD